MHPERTHMRTKSSFSVLLDHSVSSRTYIRYDTREGDTSWRKLMPVHANNEQEMTRQGCFIFPGGFSEVTPAAHDTTLRSTCWCQWRVGASTEHPRDKKTQPSSNLQRRPAPIDKPSHFFFYFTYLCTRGKYVFDCALFLSPPLFPPEHNHAHHNETRHSTAVAATRRNRAGKQSSWSTPGMPTK